MQRTEGTAGVKLIECVSPARNKWRVRWDVQEHEDGSADYMEAEFAHKPTDEEIKAAVIGWYNQQTDQTILSGFEYEGDPVWLSSENQFNYKAAYDLAVQTGGASLPVTLKLGTLEEPEYVTFEDVETFSAFYIGAIKFIQKVLEEGWNEKDKVDWTKFECDE